MPCPILNTLKIYALAGLVVLVTGLLLGNVNSSFAVEPMVGEVGDIEMWIDTSEKFDDEATMFNNRLNVFIAAYIATDGNLDIVVLDDNTICISARTGSGGCSSNASPRYRHVETDVESNDALEKILSAYDQ